MPALLRPPADPNAFTTGDWIALAAFAAFFGFVALGAWRLWRIKRRGMAGHAHAVLELGDWFLPWPAWWPDPRPLGPGWWAGPLDHDGRLEIHPLAGARAALQGRDFLEEVLRERGIRLDETLFEEVPGAYGEVVQVEGRADLPGGERAWIWMARVPGPAHSGLFLAYRSSVLYGLADGFWLHEISRLASREESARYRAPAR